MARELYQRQRDKTTRDAGYAAAVTRVERNDPDLPTLVDWLMEHRATPPSERCNFHVGYDTALDDLWTERLVAAMEGEL